MKKTLALILTFVLLLCFAGCGKNDGNDNTDRQPVLTHGVINDNVYKNPFANITFTAPKGWKFFTDSELLSNTDDTEQTLTDEKLLEIFTNIGLAYDMTAYSDEINASVGLIFANKYHEEFIGFNTKDLVLTMIEQIGLDTSGGITEQQVTLGNDPFLRIVLTSKTGTGETGYATFYGRETDHCIILIVAACTDNFTVADCEACFS